MKGGNKHSLFSSVQIVDALGCVVRIVMVALGVPLIGRIIETDRINVFTAVAESVEVYPDCHAVQRTYILNGVKCVFRIDNDFFRLIVRRMPKTIIPAKKLRTPLTVRLAPELFSQLKRASAFFKMSRTQYLEDALRKKFESDGIN
jgi:hypothetical protein